MSCNFNCWSLKKLEFLQKSIKIYCKYQILYKVLTKVLRGVAWHITASLIWHTENETLKTVVMWCFKTQWNQYHVLFLASTNTLSSSLQTAEQWTQHMAAVNYFVIWTSTKCFSQTTSSALFTSLMWWTNSGRNKRFIKSPIMWHSQVYQQLSSRCMLWHGWGMVNAKHNTWGYSP